VEERGQLKGPSEDEGGAVLGGDMKIKIMNKNKGVVDAVERKGKRHGAE